MSDNNDIRKARLDELAAKKSAAQTALDAAKKKTTQVKNPFGGGIVTVGNTKAVKSAQSQLGSINKEIDTEQKVVTEEQNLLGDVKFATQNVDNLGLDLRLDRIRDDAAVQQSRDAYAKATDLSLVRDAATERLQGAEQSTNRQLLARLSQSGVKGGLAGGALTDMASMNLRNRASLERDLAVQNVAANQQRAQFETQLAQFDLGQAAAEKSMRNTATLGLTQYSQLLRSSAKSEDLAKNLGTMKGGNGTVLCTAMFHHGLISPDVFYCDIEAGRKFLLNKQTRKAFLKYNKVCKPIANFAIKHYWFALLISPIIVPIAKHFSDNNKIGKFLFSALSAPFKFIARF